MSNNDSPKGPKSTKYWAAQEKLTRAQVEFADVNAEHEEVRSSVANLVAEAMTVLENEFDEADRSPSVVDALELLGEAFNTLHK